MTPFHVFDVETPKTTPGNDAPPFVCLAITDGVRADVIHRRDPAARREVERMFDEARAGKIVLCGHQVAFDMASIAATWPEMLPRIFELYDADRVVCTIVRQKLVDTALGTRTKASRYDLGTIAKRHGYEGVDKENPWRLRYGELEAVPVRDWPEEAREYPRHDALGTFHVVISQERTSDPRFFVDQYRQASRSFALQLVRAWGIRTDGVMTARYRAEVEARLKAHEELLLERGLIRWDRKKGTFAKEVKRAKEYAETVWSALGQKPPRTPPSEKFPNGQVQLNEDAATRSGDPVLIAFQEFGADSTLISRVREVEAGVYEPIHTNFDSLLVTGRTSSSGPPIQNRPTEPGDRECFVPRKGFVFCDADYDGLELRTLAQVTKRAVGRSRLAEVLNAGGDPHAMIAASLLSVSLDEVMRRKEDSTDKPVYLARQTGKIGNFGLGGGLGWKALVEQARIKYGMVLTEREAKNLIHVWHETWPEMRLYFNWIRDLCQYVGPNGEPVAVIQHLFSQRWRGMIPYTEACNTFFQGLGSDATKAALYALVKECYVGRGYLNGCRVVNYIHDQFITEVPEEVAQECAAEKQRVIESAANEWLPDVPTKAKPKLSRRWSKLIGSTKAGVIDTRGVWEWNEAIKAGSVGHALE